MSAFALTDVTTYLGSHNFTCDTNNAKGDMSADELPCTTFCSGGWKEVIAGLKNGQLALEGYWQGGTGSVDEEAFTNLGTAGQALTIAETSTEGGPAYIAKVMTAQYELGGAIGIVAPFKLSAQVSDGAGVIRGGLAAAKQSVAATGQLGTGLHLGAVGATQYVYATFHVFSRGTTITCRVESDDNAGFTSATNVATIGPITALGGTYITRVAGPITDDYWRLRISAVTGTHVVAGAIGIGA